MGHLPSLIADLALILITGAITTLLFRRIRQPLVLGYIIAGFVVGPHLSLTPTVVDTHNVEILAEIGVIFLLFSLGLEFSFKKLKRVGGAASITALVEIICITIAGYFLGKWMGWSTMDCVFLGGMIASSSTTIIIKAFDELGAKTLQYVRIVFGVLIVEDIVVILLMVMLSTMSVTNRFEGSEMIFTIVKLVFFLVLWFVAGIFLLPTLLKKAKKLLDGETLLILSIGLCLGMVVLATQSGFSAELGAFIMGSILAETTSAEKIEHLIKPVKDLFGAIFFVSIGMLIDPSLLLQYHWPILWITLLVIFGKLISTTIGALLSGQPLKQSVQVGMSMAQVGEFAFIVATLGLSLGIISDFLFPVAVGVSAITAFTTPYMIRLSPRFYALIAKILPDGWIENINNYSSSTQKIQAENSWKKVIRWYVNIILTNGIISMAVIFLALQFLLPFLNGYFVNPVYAKMLTFAAILIFSGPFLWALMARRPNNMAYKELWLDKRYNHGPLLVVEIVRNLIGILILVFFVDFLFSTLIAVLVNVFVIVTALILFSKTMQKFYHRLETSFLNNLNEREMDVSEIPVSENLLHKQFNPESDLSPWDAHLVDMQVNPQASYIGKSLSELLWREQYGINIAYIKRGDKFVYTPGRNSRLLPYDQVGVIGSDDQIEDFKHVFETTDALEPGEEDTDDFVVQKIVVNEKNKLRDKTIRDSKIRERTNGLVVGIERNNRRILNPGSSVVFKWGDIVWIVGERKKIHDLNKE
jgi:monovalent cation:H+ antiporter-2, CPA2 family